MPVPFESQAESRLLEKAAAGDHSAFGELLRRSRPAVRRLAERGLKLSLRNRVDPLDIVQETELEAFVRIHDFASRRPMSFQAWLLRTARQRIAKTHRRHLGADKRSVFREESIGGGATAELAGATTPDPAGEAERSELVSLVRSHLAALPEASQRIIRLRAFEGRTNQEVSGLLGLSPEAAKKRYARALLRLERSLRGAQNRFEELCLDSLIGCGRRRA